MANTNLKSVKNKFDALITEVSGLRAELSSAQTEIERLREDILKKEDELIVLKADLSNRNIAEAVVGSNSNTSSEAKQKITELMREIDRCIALLNV